MTNPFLSLEQMSAVYKTEQDWLFEKLLRKLNANRNLILSADQGWGIQEYVNELGFQLAEKNPDIHTCFIDIKPAHCSTTFLDLFVASLSHRFPEVTSRMDLESSSMDKIKLPSLIAKKKKIRIAVFLTNSHLFHRFRDPISFLRTMRLKLKNQKNCVFCFYGDNTPNFRDLVNYPGHLSGLGQLFELRHIQWNHRSASIRKIFHDQGKSIGYTTSVQMSCLLDNHPFYLRLLTWHALIRTRHTCTAAIGEKALNDLIQHFDHQFGKVVESLTSKQLSFLKALGEGNQKLYSSVTRAEYQLGSTSNVARITQSLERKEIIDTGNLETVFTNPIFREWLRRCYFERP